MNTFNSLKLSLGPTKTLEAFFKGTVVPNVGDSRLGMTGFVFDTYVRSSYWKCFNKNLYNTCACVCLITDCYSSGNCNEAAYCAFRGVGFH